VPAPGGDHHPSISPYGLFRCLDGSAQIAVGSPLLWKRLCSEFDFDPDDPRFATTTVGFDIDWRSLPCGDEILVDHHSRAAGAPGASRVPGGRVRSLDQVYGSEQVESQELQMEVVHSLLGTMTLPGPPLCFFDRDDQETTRTQHTAPPVLGADGDAVRRWLSD